MGTQELPEFCERENSKLFAFYSLDGNKNTMKKLPAVVYKLANKCFIFKLVKNIYFGKKIMPKERR
jgi:hypothetical protein